MGPSSTGRRWRRVGVGELPAFSKAGCTKSSTVTALLSPRSWVVLWWWMWLSLPYLLPGREREDWDKTPGWLVDFRNLPGHCCHFPWFWHPISLLFSVIVTFSVCTESYLWWWDYITLFLAFVVRTSSNQPWFSVLFLLFLPCHLLASLFLFALHLHI